MTRKCFIFLEFTRERSTCDEMVKILRDSGQFAAANLLKTYNTSPRFIPYSNETEIPVTLSTAVRSDTSKCFKMDKKPTGMCIIINNVKDVLNKDSLRFKSVFEQLSFEVDLWYDKSANEIKTKLEQLSQENKLNNHNAIIVMNISHGHNEKVIAFDQERLRVADIVDIFSEANCSALKRKPKLLFFNCCRIKSLEVPVVTRQVPEKNQIIIELETVGYELWYVPNKSTFFGQALSHCIAQYACDRNFQTIMNLTSQRLCESGSPEIRCCKVTRELYFDPRLPRDKR